MPNYRTKEEQIALFDGLVTNYPSLVQKETIGQTVLGKPIFMYRIGNPKGGKILLDTQIHGGSDLGTEVYYLYAKWILESNEPEALNIRNKNCTLIIPIINRDRYVRKNQREVDLNRNFTYNWSTAGSSDPASNNYRGATPASEPETQALINVFKTEKPAFYVNGHMQGGPYIASLNANVSQQVPNEKLASAYQALAQSQGVEVYSYSSWNLTGGFAASDAALFGIQSWIIEMSQYSQYDGRPPFEEIQTKFYPKVKPFLVTLSQACQVAPQNVILLALLLALPIVVLLTFMGS